MSIERPDVRMLDEGGGAVFCRFGAGSVMPTGRYRIEGGLAWPAIGSSGIEAYALVAARHEETGVIYIAEEGPWVTIGYVMPFGGEPDQRYPSLDPILMRAWSGWLCRQWWYREENETAAFYRREIQRMQQIRPKPELARIDWSRDDREALTVVGIAGATGRLVYGADRGVAKALMDYNADNSLRPAALSALMAALMGLERRPSKMRERRVA